MSRWFRLYDDVIHDPKLLKLPDNMRWIWVAMLCIASKNGGALPPVDDVALSLRVPDAKAAEYITKLVKAKLLDSKDGVFVPHNWDGRQFKSDTSNDRVKRHRETKRNVTPPVTCNVTSDVTGTVTVTAPEQSIAETESKQSKADAQRLDENGLKQESLLKMTFNATCHGRQTIPDMSIIATWLLDGITMSTISTTVPPILKRKQDMASLAYCDAAVREAHSKAGSPNLQVVSNKVFVEAGTLAWQCWQSESKRLGGRGYPIITHHFDYVAKEGFWFDTEFPADYDEQTGERIPPANSEVDAA